MIIVWAFVLAVLGVVILVISKITKQSGAEPLISELLWYGGIGLLLLSVFCIALLL